MSEEHVAAMNGLLAGSEEVAAAAKELPREYVLAYELTDGPVDGATVYWQLRLGPGGTEFALTPAPHADLRLRGDWRAALTSMAESRGREESDSDDNVLTPEGDFEFFMAAVGEQFAVARKVATTPATFPV
ncbi:hypothetical protein [Amycolatopsis saalfeldensis]|nr:hypothetical protein [Amycolatopsis saalfeldensis]